MAPYQGRPASPTVPSPSIILLLPTPLPAQLVLQPSCKRASATSCTGALHSTPGCDRDTEITDHQPCTTPGSCRQRCRPDLSRAPCHEHFPMQKEENPQTTAPKASPPPGRAARLRARIPGWEGAGCQKSCAVLETIAPLSHGAAARAGSANAFAQPEEERIAIPAGKPWLSFKPAPAPFSPRHAPVFDPGGLQSKGFLGAQGCRNSLGRGSQACKYNICQLLAPQLGA